MESYCGGEMVVLSSILIIEKHTYFNVVWGCFVNHCDHILRLIDQLLLGVDMLNFVPIFELKHGTGTQF